MSSSREHRPWHLAGSGPLAIYADRPELYDRVYLDSDWEKYEREVSLILGTLGVAPGRARILDVGCGTGTHAELLARAGCVVTGIDLHRGMLLAARAKQPEGAWVQADMRRLPVRGAFDAVTCLYGALNYVAEDRDVDAVLEGFRALVRPDGHVFLETRWSRNLRPRPWAEAWSGGTVLRRWVAGAGIAGSDTYVLCVLDHTGRPLLLDVHQLHHQDPFWLESRLAAAGFVDVSIRVGPDPTRKFDPATDEHEALLVARAPSDVRPASG